MTLKLTRGAAITLALLATLPQVAFATNASPFGAMAEVRVINEEIVECMTNSGARVNSWDVNAAWLDSKS